MKPTNETRETFSSPNMESASFGISTKDMPKIMKMLQSGIYTDKILAVLREYSANGWDAHRMVGKNDVPLEIRIPTRRDPVLKIRDFGPGLSHDDVFKVYTQYGASTKEGTNDAVGMLGIGSKSGFAYSDTFTVTSWHGGTKNTYVAVLDESVGKMSLLYGEPCAPDDTGVEIQIAVRPEDVYEFERKAKELYRHYIPRPIINVELPPVPEEQTVLQNGTITGTAHYGSEWVALMGCVPYRVNLTQLDQTKISKCLTNLHGLLFFNIGDVEISVSREELEYTKATKAKLVDKFNDLVDEYVLHALSELEKPGVSDWDKRLKVQVLKNLDLPIPEEYEEYGRQSVKIKYAPGTFTLLNASSNVATMINIASNTRILLDDTGKALVGYYLRENDYVVRAAEGKTIEATEILLRDALVASGLGGVTIEKLSNCSWTAPYVKPKKQTNPKHKAKMFVLSTVHDSFSSPYSDYWELVTRETTKDDVYVVISGFQADSYSKEFWMFVREDRALAKYFGVDFPTVYGYKTSEKAPVDVSKIEGIEYKAWRETFIKSLLTPDNLAKIEASFWLRPGDQHTWPSPANRVRVENDLGSNHPIVVLMNKQATAKHTDRYVQLLGERAGIVQDTSEAGKAWDAIIQRYPLLKTNFSELWPDYYGNDDSQQWRDYVKMMDERVNLQMHVSAPTGAPTLTLVPNSSDGLLTADNAAGLLANVG